MNNKYEPFTPVQLIPALDEEEYSGNEEESEGDEEEDNKPLSSLKKQPKKPLSSHKK